MNDDAAAGRWRRRASCVLAALLLPTTGCRPAETPSPAADRAAILAIYEDTRAAHFDRDPERFLAAVDSGYWVVSEGGARYRDKEEALEGLREYLTGTTFTTVSDIEAPRITVAPGGDVAWLIGRVEVRGETRGEGGGVHPLAFRAAWVDIYRKYHGHWRLVVHANTERDLPGTSEGG